MKFLFSMLFAVLLTSCVTTPKPETFFQLTPSSAKYKALQSRIIESSKDKELLSASAAVLQDLGFLIE